jgi:hypothetical protein
LAGPRTCAFAPGASVFAMPPVVVGALVGLLELWCGFACLAGPRTWAFAPGDSVFVAPPAIGAIVGLLEFDCALAISVLIATAAAVNINFLDKIFRSLGVRAENISRRRVTGRTGVSLSAPEEGSMISHAIRSPHGRAVGKGRGSALGFLALLGMMHGAAAQPYPSRPVTLVVPFAAGGQRMCSRVSLSSRCGPRSANR